MFNKIALFCTCFALGFWAIAKGQATTDIDYFLKPNIEGELSFAPGIQTPEEFLGYRTGEWHITHDQLVSYMRYLASVSEYVSIEETGRTYENRPLLLLTISSKENMARIDEVKAEHAKLVDPTQSSSVDVESVPAVVYLGYSIHGNEASGSNAVPMLAYALAACTNAEFRNILSDVVVLLDPSLNPDGMQRFSTWVNMHKSLSTPNPDPQDREHSEAWPGGRTNHYWFDLNRDWMPVQHPESQARIAQFHSWYPNILIDAHEMGTNATYFFQPGIESRNNPLTPENTYALTREISKFHGAAMDNIGSLYYTREGYDDYYLGKGATYPDVNGGVAILFEQASSRGHAQDSENGEVTFPFAIRNQLTTSIGTLHAAKNLRKDLLEHQRDFYSSAVREARQDDLKAYSFGSEKDPRRSEAMLDMLIRHNIEVYEDKDNAGHYLVPLQQPQYRFVKGLFETRTQFQDSLFYDVSTWTMPFAYNLNFEELRGRGFSSGRLGAHVESVIPYEGKVHGGKSDYAYVFETHGYYAHRAIYKLLAAGLRVKLATQPFSDGDHDFDYGSVLIPVVNQSLRSDELYDFLVQIAKEDGVDIYPQGTGYTSGIQLGSPSMEALRMPKVAVLTGQGVTSYEAGEVWHLLDYRYRIPVTLLPTDRFGRSDLAKYNVLVMVSGNYSFSDSEKELLKDWVRSGGVLVSTRTGSRWLSAQGITNVRYKKVVSDNAGPRPYELSGRYRGAQVVGGAIFEASIDPTHPLTFGIEGNTIHLFRNHTNFMDLAKNSYANPIRYTENPLASGYISQDNLAALGNTAAVQVSSMGRGRIVSLTDNPNFRAFWYGTNKLFLNSIFYGHIISGSTTE